MTGVLIALLKVYLAILGILLLLGAYATWTTWRDHRRHQAMVVVDWDIVREAEAILAQAAAQR